MKAFVRRLISRLNKRGMNGVVFKTILSLLIMGGVFIFIKPISAVESGDVVINELMWMGSSASSADEWIELKNTTEETIDLSGWELTKFSSGNETLMLTLPSGSIIEPQGYFLISNYDGNNLNSVLNVSPQVVDTDVSLSNTNLEIKLYDGPWQASTLIDRASDGNTPLAGNYSSGSVWESMERNTQPADGSLEENWHTATFALGFDFGVPDLGTPKSENSEIPNQAPEAHAGPDRIVLVDEVVYFDGSDSFDADSDALTYQWDFGDEEEDEGVTPTHIYNRSGIYEVWLTVSDGEKEATDNLFVTVNPPASYYSSVVINELLPNPSADENTEEWIELKNTGQETVNLAGWILEDGSRNYTVSAEDFDSTSLTPQSFLVIPRSVSGIALNNTGGEIVSLYQPNSNLLHRVSYLESVSEDEAYARKVNGDYSWTTTLTPGSENIFTFLNQPPVAEAGEDKEIIEGELVEFDGSDSFDPDSDALSFFWDFGDGEQGEGVLVSHSYNDEGEYVVSLFVTDSKYESEDSLLVTVSSGESKVYSQNIIINEVYPNPEGDESYGEFIELKNIGEEGVDLEGWVIEDLSGKRYIIDAEDFESTVVDPHGYFVIYREFSNFALNNYGEEKVNLYQPNGELLDSVGYTGSVSESQSYALIDENWLWTETITPGEENQYYSTNESPIAEIESAPEGKVNMIITFDGSNSSDDGEELNYFWNFGDGEETEGVMAEHSYNEVGTYKVILKVVDREGLSDEKEIEINITDYDYSDLVLVNEIFPAPENSDSEDEWIELINLDSRDVDLGGWVLTDNKTYFQIQAKTIIKAGGYLVFNKEVTKISLNNTGEKILLIDPKGKIVNGVEYQKAVKGLSFSRIYGTDNWAWTKDLTPAEENKIDGEVISEKIEKVKVKGAKDSIKEFIKTVIAKLKELALKTLVEVTGFVVVEPGIYGTNYFYIFDGEAGIKIYSYKKEFPELEIGQKIRVSGTLSEAEGERKINVSQKEDIEILEEDSEIPSPIEIDYLNEDLVGSLVTIEGIVLNIEASSVYLETEEGETIKIYLKRSANIDKKVFQEGENFKITGVISKSKEELMIMPRSNEDIEKLGKVLGESVVSEDIELASNNKDSQAKKYLLGLGGTLVVILVGLGVKWWKERKKDRDRKKK